MKTNTSNTLDRSIHYFRFPKRIALRKLWIEKCHSYGNWNPDYSRICSLQFSPNDFKTDLRAELMGLLSKVILQPYAVPSLKHEPEQVNINSMVNTNVIIQECITDEHLIQIDHKTSITNNSYIETIIRLEKNHCRS